MQFDISLLRETFFEEAVEHLLRLESGLLRLEQGSHDKELLNDIFRCVHSIKGGSVVFRFETLTQFTHAFEGILDQLRAQALQPTRAATDLLLRATDVVKALVSAAQHDSAPPPAHATVLAELEEMRNNNGAVVTATAAALAVQRTCERESATYHVVFIPSKRVLRLGLNPLLALADLSRVGTVLDVHSDTSRLPALVDLEPQSSYLGWSLQLQTNKTLDEIRDVFAFFEHDCALRIEAISDDVSQAPTPEECPASFLTTVQPLDNTVERAAGDTATLMTPPPAVSPELSSIRVPVEKANKLIDLVGEMIIQQSMLMQILTTFSPQDLPRLQDAVAGMTRNTRELQEQVMAVRMLPISMIFQRFPRLVRDLGQTFGKQIVLHIAGEETELDKSVIEHLSDPLTHLMRNAVDHGIETPAVRCQAGKSAQGTIHISAFHQGSSVIVEVCDDGAGLDPQRIRQRAVERGMIRDDEALLPEQGYGLIFQPGFSTAPEVNAVSGRGVGLDVVKQNVEAANGTVSVSSEPGRGTRFRLKVPLTLAILDGLLLRVGVQTYILPLTVIIESFRPRPEQLNTIFGEGEVVNVRGAFLPLLRLHRLLHLAADASDPTKGLVVTVEYEGRFVSLLVDDIIGQQQVVMKSLEANFRKIDGIAGATILGDGQIGLILDVAGLMALARAKDDMPRDGRVTNTPPSQQHITI